MMTKRVANRSTQMDNQAARTAPAVNRARPCTQAALSETEPSTRGRSERLPSVEALSESRSPMSLRVHAPASMRTAVSTNQR